MSAGTQGTYSITVEIRGAQEAGQQFKSLADHIAQADTRFKQSATSINQAGQGFQRLGQQVQSSNTPLQTFTQNVTTTQQRSQQLVGTQGALGNAFRQTGSNIQGAVGGLTQYNTMLGNTGQQTATLRQRLGELGSSFAGVAGSITGVIGSGTMLFQTLTSLKDAQFQLDRSNLQVEFRLQRVAVRQAYVNKLQKEGKTDTQTYSLAVSQLALTKNRLKLALESNEKAHEWFNIQLANFAGTVGPAAMIMVGSLVSTITQLTAKNAEGVTGLTRLSNAFKGLLIPSLATTAVTAPAAATGIAATGTASTAAAGGVRGLGTAFQGLLLRLGPIGLAIIAIGSALAAIATDFGGFRTQLEGVGQSLGRTVPILQPFLEGLQGIGAQLGLTGESAEEAAMHFERAGVGMENLSTLWHDTLAQMQSDSNEWVSTLGNNLVRLSDGVAQQRSEIQSQLDMTTDTFNTFVDQLSKQDYSGVFDTLVDAVGSLPEIIWKALQEGAARLGEVGKLIHDAIQPGLEFAWNSLVGLAGEAGKRIQDAFWASLAFIGDTIDTNITKPIQNAFNNLAIGINDIGTAVYDALGLDIIKTKY